MFAGIKCLTIYFKNMHKIFLLFGASALVVASCVSNPTGKKAETTDSVSTTSDSVAVTSGESLTVDTAKSTVAWLGKKVTGEHDGIVKIKSGSLTVSNNKLTGGKFTIDLNTISAKLDGDMKGKLEGHLKSPDFFDVAKFPEATFEITKVEPGTADSLVKISGNLTLKGVSKNITFDATLNGVSATSITADADFNIAREDWGITYAGKADDLISKEINLKVHLVASK
ncbi:Polyisoprenoid-binding protein YceI [bacterium A37T11]|nr:Polyisoprenoid-binding protein YceI [bacterium A37T11]